MNDFAIFILTHGRPNNQITRNALRKAGYTGKIYTVVDDEDPTIDEYRKNYGDVIVFNKEHFVQTTDTAETVPYRNFAVFARNAIEYYAKELGYTYFGMFDDDIMKFRHRYEDGDVLRSVPVYNMDEVIHQHLTLMENAGIATMSFGINTNFMGGVGLLDCSNAKYRMCFNSYIRNSNFKVSWKLNMWEDVITSALCNVSGQIWLQSPHIQMDMSPIGGVPGGNSEVYKTTTLLHQ